MVQEEETPHYSKEARMTGIKLSNTRLIEVENYSKPCIGIFGAFYEFDRLGVWVGTLEKSEVIKVRDYLNDWLKRKFTITT